MKHVATLVSVVLAGAVTSGMTGCQSGEHVDNRQFKAGLSLGSLKGKEFDEVSGIAASLQYDSMLWTHNDSGDKARIFLITSSGAHRATIYLKGAINRDWEDMAAGPGPDPSLNYLYVGDIGDNFGVFKFKTIYRFAEPIMSIGKKRVVIDTVKEGIDAISFTLPDRPRDMEAMAVDPLTRDIYLFSKREKNEINVYRLPYPQSADTISEAQFVTHLPVTQVTAADISPDGSEVLIKNYKNVYYWRRSGDETLLQLFSRKPSVLPYEREPQGEAVAFDRDGSGYYTVSEVSQGKKSHVIFYERKRR